MADDNQMMKDLLLLMRHQGRPIVRPQSNAPGRELEGFAARSMRENHLTKAMRGMFSNKGVKRGNYR